MVKEDPPEGVVEEDPPEVVVEEDPPRSGGGRGPPQCKDQTRPAGLSLIKRPILGDESKPQVAKSKEFW